MPSHPKLAPRLSLSPARLCLAHSFRSSSPTILAPSRACAPSIGQLFAFPRPCHHLSFSLVPQPVTMVTSWGAPVPLTLSYPFHSTTALVKSSSPSLGLTGSLLAGLPSSGPFIPISPGSSALLLSFQTSSFPLLTLLR